MSVNDWFTPLIEPGTLLRPARGLAASALSACLVCASIGTSHAASNRFAEFPTAATFAPSPARQVNDLLSASFDERFAGMLLPSMVKERATRIRQKSLITASLPDHRMTAGLPTRPVIVAAGTPIVGVASTYNPGDPKDIDAGNEELASGELYDPDSWSAAIQTDLRGEFGGVRFGKNYQPFFALVEANGKQVIVKINDVGPLRSGRIIDLNVRTMRHFDPTMELGLIGNVKVTPLAGQEWALGPIVDDRPVAVASRSVRSPGL